MCNHHLASRCAGTLPLSFVESLKFCEDLRLLDLSGNDGIEGSDEFRDTLRRYLPK
jgi:hypothetical protein